MAIGHIDMNKSYRIYILKGFPKLIKIRRPFSICFLMEELFDIEYIKIQFIKKGCDEL